MNAGRKREAPPAVTSTQVYRATADTPDPAPAAGPGALAATGTAMTSSVLHLYRRLEHKPLGRWLFSRLVCWKAPYFSSIAPRTVALAPGRGEATLRHRRRVSNHLGTVHAIALCNLAEFIGGLTTDVSIPASMRWIPRGMTVEYLKKARGTMHAVATPLEPAGDPAQAHELPVRVDVSDDADEVVFRATIRMWVAPRRD